MSLQKGISFIGGGNMAEAIISAIINAKILSPGDISVFDPSEERCSELAKLGINIVRSNEELIYRNDILFLAVKPQVINSVLSSFCGKAKNSCIVSIAAGISTSHIKTVLKTDIPVIRVLPNTPMLTLNGMTVIADSPESPTEIFEFVKSVFKAAGEVIVLPEDKINESIPLSSSSPAFFFRMLDAMAEAGSSYGISYEEAFKLSAVAMQGSAKYALESDKTPKELIRQVSSPGGTTVAALSTFDDFNFEEFIGEVIKRCVDRAYELGKEN